MPRATDFTLYLSGGWHVTRATNRIEGLPVDPENVDVVFKENVTHDPPSATAITLNWVAVPLLCLFLTLYLLGLSGVSRLGLTDAEVVDALEDAGAVVVQTDRNFHRILASERWFWGGVHLAFVVLALFGLPIWLQYLSSITTIGVVPYGLLIWLLLSGAVAGGFFIVGTMEARNYAIVDQIETHVERHPEWTTGCLVVGGAHVSHLEELIEASDVIHLGEE